MGGLATAALIAVLIIMILVSVFEVNLDDLGVNFGGITDGAEAHVE